ncbi:MAG: DUF1272 domain-containing protein [Candidatus Eremiobacteraeota bacterium]|nr:DUF1272 domain-containing protein [Candidatus Eremiobacteraeota bacterium]
MKNACERCGRGLHSPGDARSCSHGCTFCIECSAAMEQRCPNCGGELKMISESG